MKKIIFFTVLLLLLTSASFVTAGPFGKDFGIGTGYWMNPSALSNLNLTTEQSEKIRVLRETYLKETTALRTQIYSKRAELKLLWVQTNPDPARIKAIQKEIMDLTGQILNKTTDYQLEFRNILTPEQLTNLLAQGLGKRHGARWDKKGGRGKGIGQCGRR